MSRIFLFRPSVQNAKGVSTISGVTLVPFRDQDDGVDKLEQKRSHLGASTLRGARHERRVVEQSIEEFADTIHRDVPDVMLRQRKNIRRPSTTPQSFPFSFDNFSLEEISLKVFCFIIVR